VYEIVDVHELDDKVMVEVELSFEKKRHKPQEVL